MALIADRQAFLFHRTELRVESALQRNALLASLSPHGKAPKAFLYREACIPKGSLLYSFTVGDRGGVLVLERLYMRSSRAKA